MIQLNEAQRGAVEKGQPVRIKDPDLGRELVILRADLYETIHELLHEEADRQAIAAIAGENALGLENEGAAVAGPSQAQLLAELKRRSFVPPPGTPDSVELLREDRQR